MVNLSKLYNVTTDFILTGEKFLIRMSASNGFMPFIKVAAHAGFLKNFENQSLFDDFDWFRIPGFKPQQNQKLFEVEGNSMAPTVFPGDIIICQTQKKMDNVLDGSLVLIITEDSILVKRIRRSDNPSLPVLENGNPDEVIEEKQINKQDIRELMMVRGKISGLFGPHQDLNTSQKIKMLEETLELLKHQIEKLNKKIQALSN